MERLQDPRWQRKRLGVLERAGWKCEWCGTGEVNLQVHHGFYEREAMPVARRLRIGLRRRQVLRAVAPELAMA